MSKMIFIGGTGRSGTSIVNKILASHPDAASLPFEYRFIIDPDGLVDFYASYTASWSPFLADRRLKRLEWMLNSLAREPWLSRIIGHVLQGLNYDGKKLSPRSYQGWELKRHLPNYELHVQQLMSELIEFSFSARWPGSESYQLSPHLYYAAPRSKGELAQILGGFVRNVISDLLEHTGKGFFVEDNTWNVLFAREILDFIPSAKIVHVYRDPRDVVASFSCQRWSPNDKEQGAIWYRDMINHWTGVRSTIPSDSFYEIELEELVIDPETVIKSVCEFAEISFDPVMLELDLSHSHSGRWKAEYNAEERAKVTAVLNDVVY